MNCFSHINNSMLVRAVEMGKGLLPKLFGLTLSWKVEDKTGGDVIGTKVISKDESGFIKLCNAGK